MRIDISYNNNVLRTASGNYLYDSDCFEVEIIRNDPSHNTEYRIELVDSDYIDITLSELRTLKVLLNNDIVTKLLELDKEVE